PASTRMRAGSAERSGSPPEAQPVRLSPAAKRCTPAATAACTDTRPGKGSKGIYREPPVWYSAFPSQGRYFRSASETSQQMIRLVRWIMARLIMLCSQDAGQPFLSVSGFPWASHLETHWQWIREEFDQLLAEPHR